MSKGKQWEMQTYLDQGVDSLSALPSESTRMPLVDLMRPCVAEIHPVRVLGLGQELQGH